MNDLLNYIDNMPGPTFLVFYGVVIFATLGGCWLWRSLSDPTRGLALPPIPKDPDPYASLTCADVKMKSFDWRSFACGSKGTWN